MTIKIHLIIRNFLWLSFTVLGFATIPLFGLDREAAIKALVFFYILGQILSFTFYKFASAQCTSCKQKSMYADNFAGRLTYTCKSCKEHATTSTTSGGSSADHLVNQWSSDIKGSSNKREKSIGIKNQKELHRIKSGRKVNTHKPLIRRLWDKILPKDY
jgi:hypothetical protein